MTRSGRTGQILDRLRANLRAAGIPATDADILGLEEKGFLASVLSFEELAGSASRTETPDYLAERFTPPEPEARESGASPDPGLEQYPAVGRGAPDTIAEAAALIRRREMSPIELTRRSLERIGAGDAMLNAFQIVLAEGALREAGDAEAEIAAGRSRGPLHGIPVAVKDLFDVAGTPTTAGSRVMPDAPVREDAVVVRRLRRAGAVIAGKTRLAELAYSPGSNNAHFGPTRNPWNPEHDAGGSSSGSAAAVADGMVYAALGSDTGGSVRIPAAHCGLAGLKPTYARVSVRGAVPLSWSLDHIGPLARTVADAALLLDALAGTETNGPVNRADTDARANTAVVESGVRGLRVGALAVDATDPEAGTADALEAWRAGVAVLNAAGAEVTEIALPELETLRLVAGVILVLEAAAYHEGRLRARLHEIGPFPRQRLLCAYAHEPTALVRAQQIRASLRRPVEEAMGGLDVLATPAMPSGAPPVGVPGSTRYTAPFNALGWPAITVPVGLTPDGLPLGLQIVARPGREDLVLRAAHVVQAEGPWRPVTTGRRARAGSPVP